MTFINWDFEKDYKRDCKYFLGVDVARYGGDQNAYVIAEMDKILTVHMAFTNIFTEQINNNPNPTYTIQNAPTAVVTIYFGDTILTKFVSYKIYNNIVGGEVYRVISSNDIFINSPPPTFDFPTYNVLVNSYQYPSNYASLVMGGTDNTIGQIIQNNYLGKLQFSIQRVYMSPSQKQQNGSPAQIITKLSSPIVLNVPSGQVPSQLVIVPFEDDKNTNNLTNFFQQIGTIVYFYQYTSTNTTYYYGNENLVSHPASSVLNYQNNSDNMFEQNISYNRLNTVTQENQFNFNLIQLPGIFPSTNINNTTIIPFFNIPLNTPTPYVFDSQNSESE
jgi:hypothetical protein